MARINGILPENVFYEEDTTLFVQGTWEWLAEIPPLDLTILVYPLFGTVPILEIASRRRIRTNRQGLQFYKYKSSGFVLPEGDYVVSFGLLGRSVGLGVVIEVCKKIQVLYNPVDMKVGFGGFLLIFNLPPGSQCTYTFEENEEYSEVESLPNRFTRIRFTPEREGEYLLDLKINNRLTSSSSFSIPVRGEQIPVRGEADDIEDVYLPALSER